MMSRGSFNGPGGPHTRYLDPADAGRLARLPAQPAQQAQARLRHAATRCCGSTAAAWRSPAWPSPTSPRARSTPGTGLSGVQIDARRHRRQRAAPARHHQLACDGVAATPRPARSPASTTATRRGRAADRLGLLRPGPRRPDPRKTKTAESYVLRLLQLLRLGHRLAPGRHQPRRLRRRRTARRTWRRSATSASSTTRSFNAGLNSGSSYEYEDTANRLHFYIIDTHKDADGVLHYTIGVQSLDGAGPQTRGVALADAPGVQRRRAACRPARSR